MPARRPRLPLLLGLATLTAMAHLLAAAAHLALHPWTAWPLLVLLGLAPAVGVALAMRGRPRHGAILFALTMLAAAVHTLYAHFVAPGHAAPTFMTAWIVQMLLAFELQGFAVGAILIVKPQEPRARDAAPAD